LAADAASGAFHGCMIMLLAYFCVVFFCWV